MRGRRAFLALLAGLALATLARAQVRPSQGLRVAYLSTLAPADAAARIDAVARRVEARWPAAARPGHAGIEYRVFAYDAPGAGRGGGDAERRRREEQAWARNHEKVAALLAWKPDVIFAPSAFAARAAARLTATIPIVFGCKCNPLPDGWDLVKDPARPERNLTGFTRYHVDMVADHPERRLNLQRKRIELLRMAFPGTMRRVAAIYGDEYDERKWRYEESARELGVDWVRIRLDAGTIDSLPQRLRDARADTAIVLADDFADEFRAPLVKAAAASSVPVMFPWDEAEAGAWMHYGTVVDFADKAAEYIVNILRGRPVREYPVEFPKKMELVVNLRTARAHGWEYPRHFLLLVDRAVE